MSPADPALAPVVLRPPEPADAKAMWQLVVDTQVLDVNSPYMYAVLAAHHADACVVAHRGDALMGFVVGYLIPDRADPTYFLWQVGVDARGRGLGLATRMARDVLARTGARFLETTVTPSNTASRALFKGLARKLDVPCDITEGFFPDTLFPSGQDHEPEALFRLGPFSGDLFDAAI